MKKKLEFSADRWPWQKGYSWRGMADRGAPLNPGKNGWSARFGGGWKYRLGISYASGDYGRTLMIDLLFGYVKIRYNKIK